MVKDYQLKALAISQEIAGDRKGEADAFGKLGCVVWSLGEVGEGEKLMQIALAIRKKSGDRQGEFSDNVRLGTMFRQYFGQYSKAREYHERALTINKEIGDIEAELLSEET